MLMSLFMQRVIEDDGFLPDDVMSVYGFFLGDYRKADSLPGSRCISTRYRFLITGA